MGRRLPNPVYEKKIIMNSLLGSGSYDSDECDSDDLSSDMSDFDYGDDHEDIDVFEHFGKEIQNENGIINLKKA